MRFKTWFYSEGLFVGGGGAQVPAPNPEQIVKLQAGDDPTTGAMPTYNKNEDPPVNKMKKKMKRK